MLIPLFFLACQSSKESSIITVDLQTTEYIDEISGAGDLEAKKATAISAPRIHGAQMLKIASLVDEGSLVKKGDIVCILESTELEAKYLNVCDELEMAKAERIQREAELKLEKLELIADIKNVENTLKASELNLKNIQFESANVIQLEKLRIKKSRIQTENAHRKLEFLENIQHEEMNHLDLKLKQAVNTMQITSNELDKLTIRAPANGIVEYQRNWLTGEKVREGNDIYIGMPIAKIPDLSIMQVKMMVSETEAQKVSVGQRANVQIYSIDTLNVTGAVVFKSRMAKPVRRNSKVKKIEVIVELDSCHIRLVPGLSAYTKIKIKTYQNVLALPFECIFDKDSVRIIYKRIKKNAYQPYTVRLLHHMENKAVFESKIDLPAQCAIVEPPENWIDWPNQFELPKNNQVRIDTSETLIKSLNDTLKGFPEKIQNGPNINPKS